MSLLDPEQQKAAEQAEVFDGKFPALPAGKYPCRLDEFHPHTTGSSFLVKWKIVKGHPNAGRTFIDFPSNAPEYLGKVKAIFEAVKSPLDADEVDMIGRPAWVTVSEEFDNRPEYATEKRNRVKFVSVYDGADLPAEDVSDEPWNEGADDPADEEGLV